MKTIFEIFTLEITSADKVYSKTFDLDKSVTAVKGVLFTSDKDELLYYRGSQKIEINKEEIFPEHYESKLLLSSIHVPPNQRYHVLDNQPVGNGIIKVEYRDRSDVRAQFTPYRITLYLDCIAA
jgi:hypothetical protein